MTQIKSKYNNICENLGASLDSNEQAEQLRPNFLSIVSGLSPKTVL